MNLELNEQQRLLADSVGRLLDDHGGLPARKEAAKTPEGWNRQVWSQLGELGLLGLPFAEEEGGIDAGPIEIMLVMEAVGRTLSREPFLSSTVLAGQAVRRAGTEAQRQEILPAVASGDLLLAFAHGERAARHDLSHVETRAVAGADGKTRITGAKSVVPHGDTADRLVVSARSGGEADDEAGIGLYLVDASDPGVTRRRVVLHDGTPAANITFADAHAEPLGDPAGGMATIRAVAETGIAALAAEAVGAMEAAHGVTLDYVKTRKQFDRAIGENQVVQHRLADMLVALEQARSMALLGAIALAEPDAEQRALDLARVKVQIGVAGKFVGEQAVQLHGGIGMTDEYVVGHHLRRLMVIDQMFGDAQHHLAMLAEAVK